MQRFGSVWIIQDRTDDLANAQMHDIKKIQIFLLHKRLFGGESELCWKRHRSTDTSLANGKYSTYMCKLSEYFVSVTAMLYFILPTCK